jgi:hypothetical protein
MVCSWQQECYRKSRTSQSETRIDPISGRSVDDRLREIHATTKNVSARAALAIARQRSADSLRAAGEGTALHRPGSRPEAAKKMRFRNQDQP